ncbi:MAG: hypothetical protein ACYTXA_30740 [Nostoc sp.]
MRLATAPGLGDSAYLNLVAATQPFWGGFAPALVTFLITSGCLLSSATAVSNCPRILYQLAKDGYLSPVFAVLSSRGVLEYLAKHEKNLRFIINATRKEFPSQSQAVFVPG